MSVFSFALLSSINKFNQRNKKSIVFQNILQIYKRTQVDDFLSDFELDRPERGVLFSLFLEADCGGCLGFSNFACGLGFSVEFALCLTTDGSCFFFALSAFLFAFSLFTSSGALSSQEDEEEEEEEEDELVSSSVTSKNSRRNIIELCRFKMEWVFK